MTQTDTQSASLHAYFGYRDAPVAVEWLEGAARFVTTMRFPDDDGGIMHAELRRRDAVVMVFSDRDRYQRPPRKGDTSGIGV